MHDANHADPNFIHLLQDQNEEYMGGSERKGKIHSPSSDLLLPAGRKLY